MKKNQHVVKASTGGWGVKGEGNKRNTKNFDTQKEAFEKAREIAIKQKSEVLIHGKDGKNQLLCITLKKEKNHGTLL